MKTIKVSEATLAQLDWLVAKLEKVDVGIINPGWLVLASYNVFGTRRLLCPLEEGGEFYRPSCDWAQGGPIIEQKRIDFWCYESDLSIFKANIQGSGFRDCSGPTILIATMRCYVTSELGAEVEVPEELTCTP